MSDEIKLESDKTKRNKLYKIIGIISVATILFACIIMNYFTKEYLYNGKIADNIYIQGIEVSNMRKEEATKLVNEKFSPKDVLLQYEGSTYKITSEEIDLKYNTEKIVEEAYNNTRTGSYFEDIKSYIQVKSKGKKYSIGVSYNEENLEKSLEEIANDINQSVSDAKVSISGGINIIPSKEGKTVEVEENKNIIVKSLNDKDYNPLDLKVSIIKPKISTQDVSSINTSLASFSTSFNASLLGRSHNIGLSAQKCNDVILLPGETFSYNDKTGLRIGSNGYQNAPVIINNAYEEGPGGGVCQTSTTLFNAVLLSGLQIDEVHNHSKTSRYAPRGRDAMVNDGGSDFRFTNNFDHAIYVQCYRSGSSVYAVIYGSSQDKVGVSIDVDHFTYNNRPAAKTYRTITKNGKSEKSYIYTSVYKE